MKRRLLSLLLAGVMIGGLAGCTGEEPLPHRRACRAVHPGSHGEGPAEDPASSGGRRTNRCRRASAPLPAHTAGTRVTGDN